MEPYILYSRLEDRETVLEVWGASTKHPDVIYRYSNWKDRAEWLSEASLVFQWLLYCASKLSLPFNSWALAQFACDLYDWNK